MVYRVILLANGEYKKTLYRCRTKESVFLKYHSLKEENKNVMFPKKFLNGNSIKSVNYEIGITKINEEGDNFRTLRDNLGKLYTEPKLGDWTILITSEYFIEETFWIYGFDKKINRPTIKDIVKKIMIGAHSKKKVKQIIVVHNKLIIYDEEQFDMVICKNLLEAQRLHHTLAKIVKKQKIKSLLFMGTCSKAMIGRYYDLIHEKTGWAYTKIYRTSTRP